MTRQDRRPLETCMQEHVETLLRQPRSIIRYPFTDPGSVDDGSVRDWVTCWFVHGLFPEEPNQRILLHAEGNVRSFFGRQQHDGAIPMMIEAAE